MTTDPFPDDSWDELTRELGVEKSPPAREPEPEQAFADEVAEQPGFEDEPQGEEGEFDGDLGEESEGDAPDGTEPATGDEQPGPGRKRRRRRRRRKKGPGVDGEAAEAGTPEEAVAPVPQIAPRPARVAAPAPMRIAREEPEYPDADFDSESEENEPAGMPLAADEDTAGEMLRDLIANWNVPSWDAIITGLNRPH